MLTPLRPHVRDQCAREMLNAHYDDCHILFLGLSIRFSNFSTGTKGRPGGRLTFNDLGGHCVSTVWWEVSSTPLTKPLVSKLPD